MALPIGKLTIIIGAGIVGSVLAKEGSIPTVSDIFSGAFKVFWKQIRHDDSKATPSRPKPQNDSLLQQVNSLRQELQLLASNRSVTIVTSGGSGSRRYGIVVVVIVVGCGYIWWKIKSKAHETRDSDLLLNVEESWLRPFNRPARLANSTPSSLDDSLVSLTLDLIKPHSQSQLAAMHFRSKFPIEGWKLPDMMFATRRSLSNASSAVTKQLENATKRHLSSRIDRVDCNLDECAELTAATREEVSELRGEVKVTCVDVQSVHHAVRTLETKIHRIEGKQATPSSSSRPALEMPQMTPSSGTESPSPIPSSVELPSPSASNGTTKELRGISVDVDAFTSPGASNGINATGDTNNGNSGARMLGRTMSGISASLITRTRSAMQSFK
ncbi:hypothetical protein RHSIM_Rhsim12G0024000 [Rhododendron simsii]|uniref:DUF1664 domain-containing protein n=1 Tax=Rhododendron simsii TaxID=118357 RepID=A0A834L8W8_RHOSS|nr:hypothetical protein RHSIM_Rhsim12G0024000 [Rhododendron simsii]